MHTCCSMPLVLTGCVWQEYCLQSIELMVLAAPNDAKGFYDVLFPVVLSALSYDPNYTESMEDDEEDEDVEEDE